MQAAELIGKTPDELKEMLGSLKKEMFNIRFQRAAGEQGAQSRTRQAKKDVARILTVINGGAKLPSAQAEKPAKKVAAPKKATAKKAKKEE